MNILLMILVLAGSAGVLGLIVDNMLGRLIGKGYRARLHRWLEEKTGFMFGRFPVNADIDCYRLADTWLILGPLVYGPPNRTIGVSVSVRSRGVYFGRLP